MDRLSPLPGELELSTDADRLDRGRVHRWLSGESTQWMERDTRAAVSTRE